MDSFELNKIIGAILGTLLFVMGVGFIAEAIYAPTEGRGPGYELPVPEGTETTEQAANEEPQVSLGTLLAAANAEQGAAAARKCQSCHNFEQGAGNKQGPELFDVVGRQIASVPGFSYSEVLQGMGAAGDTWSYEHLDAFLTSPKDFAPKTKMNFGGVKDPKERANIIAYLASDSPDAPPFPAAEPAAEGDAAAAAGATPAVESAQPVESNASAVETPTATQGETPVAGTPVQPTTPAPAGDGAATGEAAPAEGAVPEVPAGQ